MAGGNAATFSVYGHPVIAVPVEALRAGRQIFVEVDGIEAVVLTRELYESIAETLDVLDDPDAMASLRDAKAATGDDLTLEEVRRLVAERDQ
nr:hypothetical protein GCM10020092_005200 [Actinoplanes digitatis]